ncbi:hypothetical protein FN976_28365 [Caenimonas sedimenti]|uniref:Uncharacterized protein n=1 Tax=Caenimonas sedimenti TaxID=2596921 RepID=A0A562ZDC2_9BURK|nr:hypothetical protein [Caenimonas sedimenti]TWO64002.1 hypothetical protein FN976_28365 [Caenimonas sedimenti]
MMTATSTESQVSSRRKATTAPSAPKVRIDKRRQKLVAEAMHVISKASDTAAATHSALDAAIESRNLTYLKACIATWAVDQREIHDSIEGAVRRGHEALYKLIGDGPYAYAARIENERTQVVRELMILALSNRLVEMGFMDRPVKKMTDKAVFSAAVKAMFGEEDRRLVHVYSTVCWRAHEHEVPASEFAAWVKANHGIERIRRGIIPVGKLETQLAEVQKIQKEERANKIAEEDRKLSAHVVGRVKPMGMSSVFRKGVDKQFVLLATYTAAGELLINGVVQHDNSVVGAVRRAAFRVYKDVLSREEMSPSSLPILDASEGV